MKLTLSWLKEYLDTTATAAEISEKLTSIGLEIEEVVDPTAAVAHLIVAQVDSCEKHPDSDHLHILSVNTGKEHLQVVCGAPNAHAGMKSILARPGDFIPAFGDVLKKGTVSGVESCGMMCSERELGVGPDDKGIIELPETAVVGASLTSVYPSDPLFDVSITPNRGDCMSVWGIARDLAAAGLGTLTSPKRYPLTGEFKSAVVVKNDAQDVGCPLFVMRDIKNVKNTPSPVWMQNCLTAVGLRPISALVDITNFFTVAFGRPLHVFDADKVKGALVVRPAKQGEKLTALDGKEYTLDEGMVVIADDNGVQSLGGVMGGEATGCDENTTHVLLESAYFTPHAISKAGQKLMLTSDARQRFERGVDPKSTIWGATYAAEMIQAFCGGTVSEGIITGAEPAASAPIAFDTSRVEKLCGVAIEKDVCAALLTKLGCTVGDKDGLLSVTVPTWRPDVTGQHDLIEEVLRLNGYDKLPETPLPRPMLQRPVLTQKQRREVNARRTLAGRGGYQTVTWSFMSSKDAVHFRTGKPVMLANPISADLDELRPSLVGNLLTAAGNNMAKSLNDGFLFEVGPQFFGSKPGEQAMVACALRFGQTGPRHWNVTPRAVDVFDAKADALAALNAAEAPANVQIVREAPAWYHPGRSGAVKIGKTVLAYFGELHPKVLKAMDVKTTVVACEVFLDAVPATQRKNGKTQKALKLPPFQQISRDFAFIANSDVPAEKIVAAVKAVDKTLISDVSVFDVYEGVNMPAGKKSVAVQMTVQPFEKTLTDDDIDSLCRRVIGAVAAQTGAELRG